MRKLKIKRKTGYYEATCGDVYFQIERDLPGKGWKRRQWYGPSAGWGETEKCRTLRQCKEDIIDEGWCD